MKKINVKDLLLKPVDLWMNQWFLLTAGTDDDFNMMTVSWGSMGCLWDKPIVQIFVRPQRYTYRFTEKFDSFTLCSFPEKYRTALNTLGSVSGRDGNKLTQTNLTVKKSLTVPAPSYLEATLILECRKIYSQDIDPKGFLDNLIQDNYPKKDYHRMYFGEILAVFKEM